MVRCGCMFLGTICWLCTVLISPVHCDKTASCPALCYRKTLYCFNFPQIGSQSVFADYVTQKLWYFGRRHILVCWFSSSTRELYESLAEVIFTVLLVFSKRWYNRLYIALFCSRYSPTSTCYIRLRNVFGLTVNSFGIHIQST